MEKLLAMAGKQTFGVVAVSLCRRKHTMSTVYRPVKTIAPAKGGGGSTQQVNISKSQRVGKRFNKFSIIAMLYTDLPFRTVDG